MHISVYLWIYCVGCHTSSSQHSIQLLIAITQSYCIAFGVKWDKFAFHNSKSYWVSVSKRKCWMLFLKFLCLLSEVSLCTWQIAHFGLKRDAFSSVGCLWEAEIKNYIFFFDKAPGRDNVRMEKCFQDGLLKMINVSTYNMNPVNKYT